MKLNEGSQPSVAQSLSLSVNHSVSHCPVSSVQFRVASSSCSKLKTKKDEKTKKNILQKHRIQLKPSRQLKTVEKFVFFWILLLFYHTTLTFVPPAQATNRRTDGQMARWWANFEGGGLAIMFCFLMFWQWSASLRTFLASLMCS